MNNLSANRERIPALRIALTTNCNLSCRYCPPNGENFVNTRSLISNERLFELLNIFYTIGFRQFGFTGGEPLLREDLGLISKECRKFKGISLKLYTNGLLLKRMIDELKNFDLIKLSLDSVDQNKYRKITGKDKLKDIFYGIRLVKANKIKIRVNVVLTKYNYSEIFRLIDFCQNQALDLKILDLNCFDTPGYSAWKKLYISPSYISSYLQKNGLSSRIIYTEGNYGIPMQEFRLGRINIRIKDTKGPSAYSPVCKGCRYFLCQEGLYQLSLTSDGKLKMCRHRQDLSVDLNHKSQVSEIRNNIMHFLAAHYFPAERFSLNKQVFSGRFGIRDNGRR